MLEAIFEILVQIVLEVMLEFAGEVLSEAGLRYFEETAGKLQTRPGVASIGYVVLGVVLGLLSCFVSPKHIIQSDVVRLAYALVSPIFLGFLLCFVSWIINHRSAGERIFRWDKFIFGIVFGGAYSLTRNWVMNW